VARILMSIKSVPFRTGSTVGFYAPKKIQNIIVDGTFKILFPNVLENYLEIENTLNNVNMDIYSSDNHTNNNSLQETSEFIAHVMINNGIMLDSRNRNDLLYFKLTVGK
jgi:hypothetical protein